MSTAAPSPSTAKKVNVFAKAKGATAAIATTKTKKETVWAISPQVDLDAPTVDQLNNAVSEVHRLHAELKTLETQEKVHKDVLKAYADGRYLETLVATGAEPPTPLKVMNDKGQTVTFVVQERGGKVSDPVNDALTSLVGADAIGTLVYEGGEFKFDALVMGQDAPPQEDGVARTVQDVVAEAISAVLAELVESGKLRAEQVESLLSYQAERRYRPNLVQRALVACGRSANRLEQFLDIVSSAVVRYVKC